MSARAAHALRATVDEAFARDVREGLLAQPKRLSPIYFYDDLGSSLFDAICRLPWYEVTRAELRLLHAHASDLVWQAAPTFVTELGPGSGEKLAVLARAAVRYRASTTFHLIDVSAAALAAASRAVGEATGARITTDTASYAAGLDRLARHRPPFSRALVLFLGSNIGNFDPPERAALFAAIRRSVEAGDYLLLGADLVKPEPVLRLAYDDPLGVTAAFNRNLLIRINRELGARFDPRRFEHAARWNPEASRVEMHLVSAEPQRVEIPSAGCEVHFAPGESIWTESSYKYEPGDVTAMGSRAGFTQRAMFIDEPGRFALALFEAT